jgi:hypothetical protein
MMTDMSHTLRRGPRAGILKYFSAAHDRDEMR